MQSHCNLRVYCAEADEERASNPCIACSRPNCLSTAERHNPRPDMSGSATAWRLQHSRVRTQQSGRRRRYEYHRQG